mmetsp:Transcript_31753/g.79646  ORF Transcript_31753/g.79646 Transcript_31753/m.79646 type:complete len:362 (+) Transcript_31753:1464-2549(+)
MSGCQRRRRLCDLGGVFPWECAALYVFTVSVGRGGCGIQKPVEPPHRPLCTAHKKTMVEREYQKDLLLKRHGLMCGRWWAHNIRQAPGTGRGSWTAHSMGWWWWCESAPPPPPHAAPCLQVPPLTGRAPSWPAAPGHAGVQSDIADVVVPKDPAKEPLHAQSIPTVRHRPVLPLVSEPVERSRVDAFTLVCSHELIIVKNPHAAANDFTNARHQQIHALGHGRVVWTLGHVERLQGHGEVGEEDGFAQLLHHLPLLLFLDVISKLEVDPVAILVLHADVVLVAVLNRLAVPHAAERPLDGRQVGVDFMDQGAKVLQAAVDGVADEVLQSIQQLSKRDERHLALEVGVLRQVAPRVRLLRAV